MSGRFRSSDDYSGRIVRTNLHPYVRTLTHAGWSSARKTPQRTQPDAATPLGDGPMAVHADGPIGWPDGCPRVPLPIARWLSTRIADMAVPGIVDMAVPGWPDGRPHESPTWLSQRDASQRDAPMAVPASTWLSQPRYRLSSLLFFLATSRPLAKNPRMTWNPSQ